MIEFKATCGHTVRAKDEDAGGVVRCSYCGREAGVPDGQDDDLDFLFKDIDQADEAPAKGKGKKKRAARKRRAKGEFDPFPIILRLIYAAAIISIVIFVGKRFLLPAVQGGQEWIANRKGNEASAPAGKTREKRKRSAPEASRPGLQPRVVPTGLYVCSTPPGATVFYMLERDAPATGRIYRHSAAKLVSGELVPAVRNDGMYVVEFALPIRNKSLKRYPNYLSFRRALEASESKDREALVRDYFLEDGADVFVDESNGQHFIVRQYRSVEVRRGRSSGVRAMFLPKIVGDGGELLFEELLKYIPPEHRYVFDTEDVNSELEFYEVRRQDRLAVVEALSRVGTISYHLPSGDTRLFAIDIHEGAFSARVLDR